MIEIDFIIPSFRSKELTAIAIKSFEKYKNKDKFNFRYLVIENSDDDSYREDLKAISPGNVKWFQNPTNLKTSAANAYGLERGLKEAENEYVFLCHNDVAACHPQWMDFLFEKISDSCPIAGTLLDNQRIKAVHIAGLLAKTEVARSVTMYPVYDDSENMIADVGDLITQYCRDNDLEHYCCRNTHNDTNLIELCNEPYKSFQVDRALNDKNEVIYMHLGRGFEKSFGLYNKPNKTYFSDWCELIHKNDLQ